MNLFGPKYKFCSNQVAKNIDSSIVASRKFEMICLSKFTSNFWSFGICGVVLYEKIEFVSRKIGSNFWRFQISGGPLYYVGTKGRNRDRYFVPRPTGFKIFFPKVDRARTEQRSRDPEISIFETIGSSG